MIFRLPKYCVKIKTKAMQASSPSCMLSIPASVTPVSGALETAIPVNRKP